MRYEILPFVRTPERADIISGILRNIAAHETLFTGFEAACAEGCVKSKTLVEMCATCKTRMATVAHVLAASNARAYEVWNEAPEVVGLIYFSDIVPGLDAKGHYVFFDGRLNDKTSVIEEAVADMFDVLGLARLTIEIPAPFAALARHAQKRLGFGGPFRYKGGMSVEGVKKRAMKWRGELVDVLLLGRVRPSSAPASPISTPSPE